MIRRIKYTNFKR